jgi:hypothetical protein
MSKSEVMVNRSACHIELDKFLDKVCDEHPNLEDGIMYDLKFRAGVQLIDDEYVVFVSVFTRTAREI